MTLSEFSIHTLYFLDSYLVKKTQGGYPVQIVYRNKSNTSSNTSGDTILTFAHFYVLYLDNRLVKRRKGYPVQILCKSTTRNMSHIYHAHAPGYEIKEK